MECRYFALGSDGPRISGLKEGPHIGRPDELNRFHRMTANALTEADYYPQVMSSRLGRGRGRITVSQPDITFPLMPVRRLSLGDQPTKTSECAVMHATIGA